MPHTTEEQCEHLHLEAEFTTSIFENNIGAAQLYTWFLPFSLNNPLIGEDFEFKFEEDVEGARIMEVTSFNPDFPLSALVELWEATRTTAAQDKRAAISKLARSGAN